MTDPTPQPAAPSVREVLEMLAEYVEAEAAEMPRRAESARLEDARAALLGLDPAHLKSLAEAQPAPPPVEEISAEEFARRESPHWAHVENAVEYVRAGRGDPQTAPAPAGAGE